MFFSVLHLLCLCQGLFIRALWSPAGKGLTSWLSFVVSNCEFVTFSLVSWVRCGTWLYRFLIFSPLLTFINFVQIVVDKQTTLLFTFNQASPKLKYNLISQNNCESITSSGPRFLLGGICLFTAVELKIQISKVSDNLSGTSLFTPVCQ